MQALACKQKQLRGRLCQNVSDLHLVSASLHARQVDLQSETLKAGKVHEQALRHAKLLQRLLLWQTPRNVCFFVSQSLPVCHQQVGRSKRRSRHLGCFLGRYPLPRHPCAWSSRVRLPQATVACQALLLTSVKRICWPSDGPFVFCVWLR